MHKVLFRFEPSETPKLNDLCKRYYEGDPIFCCEGCCWSDCPRLLGASPKEVAIENKATHSGSDDLPVSVSHLPSVKDSDYL